MSHIVKVICERHREEQKRYSRSFQLIGELEGCGYSFPCDTAGNVLTKDENYESWKENYAYCLKHPEKYRDDGVVVDKWDWMEPALAQCSCGREIRLEGDCMCECGQWYNCFGQALKDPEYWEDESI